MNSSGELCPPYRSRSGDLYRCGRTIFERDPDGKPGDRCPGGLFVCSECVEPFVESMNAAYNARARDKEWETD